jgi:hypothetical protein
VGGEALRRGLALVVLLIGVTIFLHPTPIRGSFPPGVFLSCDHSSLAFSVLASTQSQSVTMNCTVTWNFSNNPSYNYTTLQGVVFFTGPNAFTGSGVIPTSAVIRPSRWAALTVA